MSALTLASILNNKKLAQPPDFLAIDSLIRVSEEYNTNLEKMKKAVEKEDWETHQKLVKIEKRLNKKDSELRRILEIF